VGIPVETPDRTIYATQGSSPMTRSFLNIRDGEDIVPDKECLELPHVEAAQEEAVQRQ
jgi:hypothetical protein